MNSRVKRVAKRVAIGIIAFIVIVQILFFVFRNLALQVVFDKVADRAMTRYGLEMKCEQIKFRGLSEVYLDHLTIVPANGDTLLSASEIGVHQSYFKMWFLIPSIKDITATDVKLNLIRTDTSGNYFTFFKQNNSSTTTDTTVKGNLASRYGKLLQFSLDILTADTYLKNVSVFYKHNDYTLSISLPNLISENGQFGSKIEVTEFGKTNIINLSGQASRWNSEISYRLTRSETGKIEIPFIKHKFNIKADFDSLRFRLRGEDFSSSSTQFAVEGATYNMGVVSPKLAQEEVKFDSLIGSCNLLIGRDFFEMDSTSTMKMNKLSANFYARYKPAKKPEYDFKINTGEIPAENLFNSLPTGLFSNISGMKVSGSLTYNLDFHLKMENPENLIFASNLKGTKFRIQSYGGANLSRMNEPFEYTAYVKGAPVRSFIVGPENPNFRTLDQISADLKSAVLTSEDGSFFWHRGFNEEAFKGAIIENIRKGRFARGGSTISMQLVKNVFLNQNKNVARKIEEMLIVWLIENCRLSTKDKMFETYLNIIEWGPNVYGASEAAKFYFNKDADKINLSEAIFMAAVIPRPRNFGYFLDSTYAPKPSVSDYYRIVKNFMLRRNVITQEIYDATLPIPTVEGAAKQYLINLRTKPDTMLIETEPEEDLLILQDPT